MNNTRMEAEIIFESHLPDALRQALEYAGDDGFVASMPQLLHARVNAPYENEIWNYWSYTSNSEEDVAKTPQGNRVVVTVHGGGIFATPERFKKLYHSSVNRSCNVGYTGLFAAKITAQEARADYCHHKNLKPGQQGGQSRTHDVNTAVPEEQIECECESGKY